MMKKPWIFILVGGLILGCLGAGAYLYFASSGRSNKAPEIGGVTISPTPVPTLITWDDPAGFAIQYPEHLVLNKHDEDKVNYAHLEFTDPSHAGALHVWVTDLPAGVSDTAAWGKKMSTPSSAISFDTSLAGQSAQKILVSGPEKTVTVGVVYDGVLWYIEAKLTDESYWQGVYDTIVQSFVFKPLASEQGQAGGGAPAATYDTAVDEEEVLE